MHDGTFSRPDLTKFCRLDELGLQVVGQRLEPGRVMLACRAGEGRLDRWCRGCGAEGVVRDTVTRRLAHEPFGWRPTILVVAIHRYRCAGSARVRRQDTSRAARPRSRLSRRALRWALEGIVIQHLSVARVAEGLAVAWNTASAAAYRQPDQKNGRELMARLIDALSHGVRAELTEVITLGRTLHRRAAVCWPTSTGPGPATARRRPSTDGSNTFGALPSASAT